MNQNQALGCLQAVRLLGCDASVDAVASVDLEVAVVLEREKGYLISYSIFIQNDALKKVLRHLLITAFIYLRYILMHGKWKIKQ